MLHLSKTRRLLFAPFLLFLIPTLARAATPTKALCWKVSSPTATLYLLGSIHMATKDLYPLPPEIESAYAASSKLAVELDPDKVDQAALLKLMQDKGMYPDNQTLSASVAKPVADALAAWCTTNHVPAAMFEKLKPWAAGVTISALAMEKVGLDPDLGIDKHFLTAARADKKPIIELESADSQISALASFPPALQEAWLKLTLEQTKDASKEIDTMIQAFKTGNAKSIQDLEAPDEKELAPINKALIDDRNVSMAKTIQPWLAQHNTIFIVVGAAHLIGPKGIPALLAADPDITSEQMTVTQSPAATAPAN